MIYIVQGHPAGGTSMMMKVLIDGGIKGIFQEPKVSTNGLKILNNPYGTFEGKWHGLSTKELRNCVFKCFRIAWDKISEKEDIKIIRIIRPIEHIFQSNQERHIRRKKIFPEVIQTKINFKERKKMILENRAVVQECIDRRKNTTELKINYVDMFDNTEETINKIAKFVAPHPFDIDKAIKAVDKSLYTKRT